MKISNWAYVRTQCVYTDYNIFVAVLHCSGTVKHNVETVPSEFQRESCRMWVQMQLAIWTHNDDPIVGMRELIARDSEESTLYCDWTSSEAVGTTYVSPDFYMVYWESRMRGVVAKELSTGQVVHQASTTFLNGTKIARFGSLLENG